jgi:hypothetical protein
MATPQEIAAAAAEKSKKLAEDKAKSEAQKKLEEISKGRSLTEDGTDLTAPIYLNIDPTTLKWEDSIRYFVWNRFIDYLRNRNLTKKDLKKEFHGRKIVRNSKKKVKMIDELVDGDGALVKGDENSGTDKITTGWNNPQTSREFSRKTQ